jgi:hypothetical protein
MARDLFYRIITKRKQLPAFGIHQPVFNFMLKILHQLPVSKVDISFPVQSGYDQICAGISAGVRI